MKSASGGTPGSPPEELVVTGIGMASSLGGVIQACAAARAGIVRPNALRFTVGMDGLEPANVTGHPCLPVEGFEGFGRLSYLAALAVHDLFGDWSPAGLEASRSALLVQLPSADERPALDEYLGALWEQGQQADEAGVLSTSLMPLLPPFMQEVHFQVLQDGHAGGLLAVQTASELLRSGQAQACIVCCVDSYLDTSTLEWLTATGRLKTLHYPVGLMPGEGAAVFVLETVRGAKHRNAEVLAHVQALGQATEPHAWGAPEFVARGEGLATALLQVLHTGRLARDELGMLLSDLNGQEWRARDWGSALVRCAPEMPALAQARLWPIATSFGDVGSATGGFLVCNAVRAFARQYARGRQLLALASSEAGQRAVLLLSASN